MSLRELALAPKSGFRFKNIVVPEWENATVTIREPSAKAWLEWQEIIYPAAEKDEDVQLTAAESAHRNLKADILLFIDILYDNGEQVFNKDDAEALASIYGPVHARIVKQALNLSLNPEEAEKK